MKILYIAPLPPPITGQSLVSKVLLDYLKQIDNVFIVNLSKDSLKEGIGGWKRVLQVFNILLKVYKGKKNIDAIYLTISESLAGNMKDLLIYLICFNKLNNFLYKINKYFIKRFAGVIVSGESHLEIFNSIISENKIKIIPNFAQESLFISESEFNDKFRTCDPIRLLYVGGLIEMKGYLELAKGFSEIPPEIRKHFVLDIAGKFESESAKSNFFKLLDKTKGITYHGIINEQTKIKLFTSAHIFCLPTSFFEGQPISILEAYASGCLVLTTPQPGILDIFRNNFNGYFISERHITAVKHALINVFNNITDIEGIANHNRLLALSNYKLEKYVTSVRNSFETLINKYE